MPPTTHMQSYSIHLTWTLKGVLMTKAQKKSVLRENLMNVKKYSQVNLKLVDIYLSRCRNNFVAASPHS